MTHHHPLRDKHGGARRPRYARGMEEIELQYRWLRSPGRALARIPARLADLRLIETDELCIRDTYLDTPDRALAARGERLRIRELPHGAELTRKGPATATPHGRGRLRSRQEHAVPYRDTGTPLVRLVRRTWTDLAGVVGGGPLEALGVIENRRTRFLYGRKGRIDLELTLDRLSFSTGGARELRIEAEALTPQGARRMHQVAADLEAALGRGLDRPARGKVRELLARAVRPVARTR